jgi:1-acyl-sn-glycerol-3-phosphate acyltransferase
MLYWAFRLLATIALRVFFRRIEVDGLDRVPARGAVLLLPNHANSLVDPLVVVTALDRRVTMTAKHALRANPMLRALFWALDVVVVHRRQDADQGADPRQNVEALERLGAVLDRGGAGCLFPEGVSHSDPGLRGFHSGAARVAVAFARRHGTSRPLTVVPVGLHYTDKDRFRSSVWLRFGNPIDAPRWLADHPEADARALTQEVYGRVRAITLNYETRRESVVLGLAAEIVATGGAMPAPLGRDEPQVAAWFHLLARLQAGYRQLNEDSPELVEALGRRIGRYRSALRKAGIRPAEVFLPMHAGRAALFILREFELLVVGAPLAAWGILHHVVPYFATRGAARVLSTDEDHWATNTVYPGIVIFGAWYVLLGTLAWWLMPPAWAAVYSLLLPYTGYYALLYRERAGSAFRRTRTFLRFLFRPALQRELASEGRAILNALGTLASRLDEAHEVTP